jgi:predicted Rossmann fold nucleotide-binding protein DprA/Smf involved in DNA uptake
MYNAGWHAHTLDAPGKFLISAPEHPTPKRARAYLIRDDNVSATAHRHAGQRPVLNAPHPVPEPTPEQPAPEWPATTEERLWQALRNAPEAGLAVSKLVKVTGMSRATLYRRLSDYAEAGRVVQVGRGRYRATTPQTGD